MSVCEAGDCDKSDIKEEPADGDEVKAEAFPALLDSDDPKCDYKNVIDRCQFRTDTMQGNWKQNKNILTKFPLVLST